MSELDAIHESTGNVFADLDVPEPEEALAKAELARRIGHIIKRRRLNQAQAAALLSIDQPKVSALLRGKLAGFSIDRLLRFLIRLYQDLDYILPHDQSPGVGGAYAKLRRGHPTCRKCTSDDRLNRPRMPSAAAGF